MSQSCIRHHFLWLACLLLACMPFTAHAHMTSVGHLQVQIDTTKSTVQLLVAVSERDLASFFKIDIGQNRQIAPKDFESAKAAIATYLEKHLVVSNRGRVCVVLTQHFLPTAGRPRRIRFAQRLRCKLPFQKLIIENTVLFEDRGGYRHLARIQIGKHVISSVFSRTFAAHTYNLSTLLAKAPPSRTAKTHPPTKVKKNHTTPTVTSTTSQSLLSYLWEGWLHIIFGFDHVLFVLTLVVVAARFRQLLLVLTAFTVGHSLTLVLSTLDIFVLPPQPVETLIALSILYTAAENMLRTQVSERGRYALVFGFGLIHGIGFSYYLRSQVLGLDALGRGLALFSFNLGVELGQVAIVLVLYPCLKPFMHKEGYKRFLLVSNALFLVVALYWFVQRAFLS